MDALTLVLMVVALVWAHLMDWMFRPEPRPVRHDKVHENSPTPTARTLRPVTDQRPAIETFTRPRNTFSVWRRSYTTASPAPKT